MKITDYVVCILLSVCFTLLFLYPSMRENKKAWEAQIRMNKAVVQAMENRNAELFEIIKLISKK